MDLTGLSAGGQQIAKCKEAYGKTVELLVTLASLQSAFLTLDVAIKSTNRRVNALENVVKPRVANTISYIKVSPCKCKDPETCINLELRTEIHVYWRFVGTL